MVDFDTPLLKAAKKLCDAYISLDMNNVEPLMSKNYQYEVLPECTDFPKLTKEGHIQAWEGILSSVNKAEMIWHEVIEASGGKVIIHTTLVFYTVFGATLNYDSILTLTFVEEDGELKVIHSKDFADPQQRVALIAGTVKAAAERVA